jgi:hypothetical protein
VFHVELKQFPQVARRFNMSVQELSETVLGPWSRGETLTFGEQQWTPGKAELTIYEGRELRSDEISMGRGWSSATRHGEDVTARVLSEVASPTGPASAPAVAQFKEEVLAQCAGGRIGIHQVMWLANAEYAGWRVSDRLALAEQAVWELLHQHRLRMLSADGPVDPADWERIVLAWETWADPGTPTILLERLDG